MGRRMKRPRTMVKLEKNYRSTATILDAANALIANNHERIEKALHPTRDRGTPHPAQLL